MKSLLLTIAMTFLLILPGCEKKETAPVPVGEMNEYRDPAYGFRMKYPKDWKQLGAAGKALFTRSQEVANKFLDPSTGEAGGQVVVEVTPYAGKDPASMVQSGKEDLRATWASIEMQPDEQLTVAGKPATKVQYSIPITSKTKIHAYDIFVQGDTAMFRITIEGFGDQYQAHAQVFDAMVKSFELPAVVAKQADRWTPSGNLESFSSPFFTYQYPDNMESMPVSKGSFDFSAKMRADRLDCSIQVDVFGAKGLTVEKVWEQNKGKFKARGNGETTIDGNKAIWVDYSPIANIMSRTYFMVKNDKVVRPTITWFQPQRDVYFPVFENVVKSMKLK